MDFSPFVWYSGGILTHKRGYCMKKTALILCALALTLAGCTRQDSQSTQPETTSAQASAAAETTQPAETAAQIVIPDISPDTVGLYIPADDGTANRVCIMEFSSTRASGTDIDCFEVFASRLATLEGSSFTSIWNEVWDSFSGTEDSKIGFHIQISLKNGEIISKNLLMPSDSDEFFDYVEVYLYDDVHQSGWYTHLSDNDVGEDTIITSIKLHCGSRISEVGDIRLTAFIYTGDECFDAEGNYIGLVSASILITE